MAISIVDLFSALNISVTTTGDKATKSNAAFSGSMTLITGSTTISGSASMTFPNASTIDDNDEIIAYFRDYSSSVVGGTVKWSINRVGVKDNSLKLLTPTTEATGYGNEFISDVERNYIPAGTYDRFQTSLGYSDWSGSGYTFNGKIFDSYESAKAYAETGDTSGQIFNYSPPQVTCNIIKYFNSINEEAGPKTAYGKSTGYGCTMQNYNAQMFMEYTASSFHPKFIASYKASEGETSTDEVCMFIESWPITEYDGSVGWGDHACIGLCRINRLNNQLTVIHSNEWDADIDTSMDGGWYDSRSYANGFVFAGNHWGRWMVSRIYCPIGYEYIIAMHLTFNGKIFDSLEGAQKYANDETDLSGQIWAYAPYAGANEFDFYYRSRYGAEFPWTEAPIVPTDTEITQLESHANSPNNPSKNIGSGISTVYGSVSFINLGTGFNYKVAVLAHDRISGDLVGDGGAVTFTASATTMTVDVGLPIDAKDRDGHKLVLYAYLWVVGEDIPVCEHVEELDEHAFIYIGSSADDEEPEEQEPDYSGMAVDENFNNLGPIENYNSLIWTDRYSKCGDFEIYTPVDMNLFNTLGVDSYLMIPESDRYMIVEKVEIISNATDGNKMCISGRSLESILDRRIIWHKTIIDEDLEGGNTVQNAIKKLITDNIISPPNLEYRRKIPNFIFRDCATDISDLKLTGEYLGDSLYDVICNVCENNNLGFRITIEPVEGKPSFIFQLYQGKNRSFDSSDNVTRVIFSPDMGNMVDCDYIKTKEDYKNVCLVGGENAKSDDDSQIFSSWGSNEHDGISRRELYLSASDLTKKVEGSDGKTKTLSDDEYKSVLQQRGHEELAEHKSVVSIDGTMCNKMFYYGENKDYYLGDIIECEDLYGNHAKSRITEVIISKNTSSYTIYPTFEAVTSEDLSIKIIYATAETFKDDAPQPLTQNKLNTEYFTYDTETCRYTCVKECNIDIYFSWKCKDVPKTKYKSLMRVKVNSLIDPDGCYHYWEVTQGTSGHKAFDNLHCAVGAQFWFEKEEHGNAYINEFTASIHIDDPT